MRDLAIILSAALCGLLFGLGLIEAQMTDPARIIAFLDVAGEWNPALAFVMAGGILVAAPAFFIARRRSRALLGDAFELPDRMRIDRPLVLGAAIFGLGWGLSGICPGPGIVLAGALDTGALYFLPAVIVGQFAMRFFAKR